MQKRNPITYFFKAFILFFSIGVYYDLQAKEGMWLPPDLKSREADMKQMGLEIPVSMIYNEQGTGLNNAIVLFGSGCTAEVISSKGLLLTNHHCGYGTVQGLSSKEKDYFANGFWAKNNAEELPCPGLKVTFIRKMENVTDQILIGLEDTLSGEERNKTIATRIASLEKGYKYSTGLDATIKSMYNGNQYWVIIMEVFSDVRLVGFPPNGIGTFGGDTDNWMWPRHTGDFSMFRVYAGKNNKPAPYSKDNKPYAAPQFFKINASGYKEGDFTMVYGFPGTTTEYISSFQVNQVYSILDPIRIEARTKKLDVWKTNMEQSRDIFLKYTSKKASIANGWKKWQGEVRGLKLNNVIGIKNTYEQNFQSWAARDNDLPYADDVLSKMGAKSLAVNDLIKADEYIKEAVLGVELISQAEVLNQMLNVMRLGLNGDQLQDTLGKLYTKTRAFYKNYDAGTDKQVFTALMPLFMQKASAYVPETFTRQLSEHSNNYQSWASYVYTSKAADSSTLFQITQHADTMAILTDPAWQLYNGIATLRKQRISPKLSAYNTEMTTFNRLYMKAQMHLDKTKEFYPDANLSLRLTYGKVQGIDPDGPAGYSFQTNLDEAVQKANPDVEEFKMPQKLIDLQAKKNYGRWAVNGTVPLAFIANNHTSGGNSGSPILNARGELIGTNFDRIWAGTMSDIHFDQKFCRNISVDIRYTLFIVEKLGDAGWLLKEMNIVK